MSEQALDVAQVGALFEQVRGEGMAQGVDGSVSYICRIGYIYDTGGCLSITNINRPQKLLAKMPVAPCFPKHCLPCR